MEIYSAGETVSGVSDNQWVCFRARNKVGYGYAKVQVGSLKEIPTDGVSPKPKTETGISNTEIAGFIGLILAIAVITGAMFSRKR